MRTIRLAILLFPVLCLLPGCDDETDPNGPCDVSTHSEAYRCLGTKVIQVCRDSTGGIAYGDDPPGTWQYDDECGGNLTCTRIDACDAWRDDPDPTPCPDDVRQSGETYVDCVYVGPDS